MEVNEGTVVRDRCWGGRFTGTVVRREADHVFVAWHGSFVEDELPLAEVEVIEHPTPTQRDWRGGIGIVGFGDTVVVEPVGRS